MFRVFSIEGLDPGLPVELMLAAMEVSTEVEDTSCWGEDVREDFSFLVNDLLRRTLGGLHNCSICS